MEIITSLVQIMALQPVWHQANQAIIWTNFGSILIEALRANFNDVLI